MSVGVAFRFAIVGFAIFGLVVWVSSVTSDLDRLSLRVKELERCVAYQPCRFAVPK